MGDTIIRKNVKSLSPQERQHFVDAVKALKANTTESRIADNKYDDYILWHAQTMAIAAGSDANANMRNLAHRGPIFLPWHREFLRRFELDLQKEVPEVAIPYWDWAADAALRPPPIPSPPPAWTLSPIWKEDFMGGNGDPNNNNIVGDGPFKDWVTQETDDHGNPTMKYRLRRDFGNLIGTLPTLIDVYNAFSFDFFDTQYWDVFSRGFSNALEGWVNGPQLHNRVHVWVGGSMLINTSPNDPVFFLHHCNVDRIWALWQDLRFDSRLGYPPMRDLDPPIRDRNCTDIGHYNINDKMRPWQDEPDSKTISDVLDYRKLSIRYEK